MQASLRRRPADRRAQIVLAASTMFADRGFAQVSIADIAAAVDVAPSALYRHFPTKLALLHEVVAGAVRGVDLVSSAADLDAAIAFGAAGAAETRHSAVLWQREARNLDDAARSTFAAELVGAITKLSRLLAVERPALPADDSTLLAWATIAVFGSTGMHRASLPRNAFTGQLDAMAHAVCEVRLGTGHPADVAARPPDDAAALGSTRETLLTQAIRLFGERGFAAVSINDIGAAAGTSGPNIYKHFPGKSDILAAVAMRAGEYRRRGVTEALTGVADPAQRLARLLQAHITFTVTQRDLMGVLTSELHQLPEPHRKAAQQAQREYLKLWSATLLDTRPDLAPARARIIVPAALAVVDDAARTGQVAGRSDLPDRLTEICAAVLES